MKQNTLKELRKLLGRSFKTFQPSHHKKGLYSVDFDLDGYFDLLFTVSNLIKISILALESDESCSSQVTDPPTDIKNILEIALQLLPYEVAELLDKSKELILIENQDNIPEK